MLKKYTYSLFSIFILSLGWNYLRAQEVATDSTSESSSFLSSEITYFAKDSSRIDVQGKKVLLYKEAQVNFEDIELQAEHIILNWQENTVYAIGVEDSIGNIIGKSCI